MSELLEKNFLENKPLILMGGYNINLLKYGDNEDITTFLKLMLSNFLLPQILQPTRITTKSETLIDNIYLRIHRRLYEKIPKIIFLYHWNCFSYSFPMV